MALESKYQSGLIKRLQAAFPNCVIMKNDPNYIQGIPDLLVLNGDKWAALECKRNGRASHRPNQDYYVDKMGRMGYATFISPDNEEEVLDELQRYFEESNGGRTCNLTTIEN